VSRLAYQADGTLGLLRLIPPDGVFKVEADYGSVAARAASIASLECQAIARFAASVFWRAHVATRPKIPGLRLWNPQAEALRRFVRGDSPLPSRTCIHFLVPTDGESTNSVHSTMSTLPASSRKGEDGCHQFLAAGLMFNLGLGAFAVPRVCIACSSTPHVTFQNWRTVRFVHDASVSMVSSPRKGRFARWSKP
jgi:hypothetical protein